MRHVTLIAIADEYDNKPGLALKGAPVTAPGFMADREGVLIAHDLLEHVNGPRQIGSVWDELEALGAIWQVRARHGDLFTGRPVNFSMAVNVASDITRMFADWVYSDKRYCGPWRGAEGTRKHDYDSDFLECIAIARRDIPNEHDESETDLFPHIEAYLALALRRMRIGFRKAQKRYGKGFHGSNQFVAIREAVASAHVEFEGQEFRLSYGNGEARVSEIWSEEQW